MQRVLPTVVLALWFIPFTSTASDLSITDAWVRATIGQTTVTAGYVTIENTGAESDRLIEIRTDVAAKTEMHRTTTDEGSVIRMRQIDALDIRSGEALSFKPGGDHLMLLGIANPLTAGDEISLTLTFENAGDVTVGALVARRDPFP